MDHNIFRQLMWCVDADSFNAVKEFGDKHDIFFENIENEVVNICVERDNLDIFKYLLSKSSNVDFNCIIKIATHYNSGSILEYITRKYFNMNKRYRVTCILERNIE